jgi:hypothetical protein
VEAVAAALIALLAPYRPGRVAPVQLVLTTTVRVRDPDRLQVPASSLGRMPALLYRTCRSPNISTAKRTIASACPASDTLAFTKAASPPAAVIAATQQRVAPRPSCEMARVADHRLVGPRARGEPQGCLARYEVRDPRAARVGRRHDRQPPARVAGTHCHHVGPRQPDVRPPTRGPRRRGSGSSHGSRGATATRTSRTRQPWPPGCTGSSTASTPVPSSAATPMSTRMCPGFRPRGGGDRRARGQRACGQGVRRGCPLPPRQRRPSGMGRVQPRSHRLGDAA